MTGKEEKTMKETAKERLLKDTYRRYMKMAFDFGIAIGQAKDEEQRAALKRIFAPQFRPSLTLALKKAGVLPLFPRERRARP
jgi:hypothetical protein